MSGDPKIVVLERWWESINIYDGPEVFLKTFSLVPQKAGLLFAAHFAQSEICNGGFHQFFSNSTGVLAPEAIQGFAAVGMPDTARIVQSTCEVMGGLGALYPRDRSERQRRLNKLGHKYFYDRDEEFFALIGKESGGFEDAAQRYAEAD